MFSQSMPHLKAAGIELPLLANLPVIVLRKDAGFVLVFLFNTVPKIDAVIRFNRSKYHMGSVDCITVLLQIAIHSSNETPTLLITA